MLEKQARLIKALLTKTKNGEVEWKATADSDAAYQASFRSNSVRIEFVQRSGLESAYQLSLINSLGQVAEIITDDDLTNDGQVSSGQRTWFGLMGDLYEFARRSVTGADKVLDELLREIEDPF